MRFLAIVLLFCLSFAAQTTQAQHHQKIAFVRVDSVVASLPEFAVQQKTLETYAKQLDDNFKQLQSEFQQKYDEFNQLQQSGNTAMNVLEEKYKELEQLNQGLQEFQSKAEGQLYLKEQQLLQPLINKAKKAVEEVAKTQGYAFVLDVQNLLSFDAKEDITAAVIVHLKGK